MVSMTILHVFHVYLTGGFKKLRELTWVNGVISCVNSFFRCHYIFPAFYQIGYWTVKIVTDVHEAIPVIDPPWESYYVKMLVWVNPH
jgi:cytochrome b6